jgi:predicted PhzF superfamily epimerase YddE/YHI9
MTRYRAVRYPFLQEGAIMSLTIYQVDAFTDRPFAGNPAGVCLLDAPADAGWMQNVAREMNLSETAFLVPVPGGYNLRWFTPAIEVDLCGHATLASAHMLSEQGRLAPGASARFHTRSGTLTACKSGDWIEMDFPATPAVLATAPDGLLGALGVEAVYVGQNIFDYLVEVACEATVHELKPDFDRLACLPVRGVIVTSRSDSPEFDFVSRFFAPASGVNEDPVTGSAHCCLGPYWSEKVGKRELRAYQASARGGVVGVRVAGERVILRGQAVTVIQGELFCEPVYAAG